MRRSLSRCICHTNQPKVTWARLLQKGTLPSREFVQLENEAYLVAMRS